MHLKPAQMGTRTLPIPNSCPFRTDSPIICRYLCVGKSDRRRAQTQRKNENINKWKTKPAKTQNYKNVSLSHCCLCRCLHLFDLNCQERKKCFLTCQDPVCLLCHERSQTFREFNFCQRFFFFFFFSLHLHTWKVAPCDSPAQFPVRLFTEKNNKYQLCHRLHATTKRTWLKTQGKKKP